MVANNSKKAGPYAYISNSASSSVTVIDTSTRQIVVPRIRVGGNPGGLALTPDQAFLYVGNANPASHSVSVIETKRHTVVAKVDVGLCPSSVAASADGGTVYVGLQDPNPYDSTLRMRSAVCAISTATHTVTAVIDLSFGGPPVNGWPAPEGGCGAVGELAIRPGRPQLYVPVSLANKIAVIDTVSNRVIKTFQTGSGPWLAFAPDGRRFYEVNTYNLGIRVFNAADDSMGQDNISPVQCATPESLAVTPDSERLYVTCVDSNSLSVIDATKSTYPVIGSVRLPFQPPPVAITPDGGEVWVVGGGDEATVLVIETRTNTVMAEISLPDGGPDRIVIGPEVC